VLGFFTPDKLVDVAKAVITIHRDFGDRAERKHARLKYVIAERGVDWARGEVEKRAGFKLAAPRSYRFTTTGDLYGWHRQSDGRWFLTLFIETGRVKDADNHRLKTALPPDRREVRNIEFHLSPNQNVILADVSDADQGRSTRCWPSMA